MASKQLRAEMEQALGTFHPAVQRWFASRFVQVTAAQAHGWPAIRSGQDTLIAAPTGSGKTLAAFLNCIDELVRQGLSGALKDETSVLYVSPLKALSNDVQKNLQEPLQGVRDILLESGLPAPDVRVLVRTGDTSARERQAMGRKPPHILVTTPESLYILLTSKAGRAMLRTVRTLILDEIHAVARDRRGSHLALSLERLDALTGRRATRIGLSATQRPIEEVARFLVGNEHIAADGTPRCTIVNEGHVRNMDLALELPQTPLTAVLANETWEELYDRLAQLVAEQRTTLIFTNTRRLAERVSLHLAKRLGEGHVTSHHGSLSREQRLLAEQRLKAGELKALVATASLELGIDIGSVDLVCQLASPRSIATFLQRVGRAGHSLGATPRGRLFPLTRDDLVECTAVLAATRQGQLDLLTIPTKPLDVLAQQIVAAVVVEEWDETELYNLFRRAYPYRDLARADFDKVVHMLADGFASKWGRRAAHLHFDGVGQRLRARKGARIAAITSGGAIPETADYQVILEPQGAMVGTVNEDFAVESSPGDIFQLGISSWKILRVEQGKVRVEDAHGQPPTIPFWLGEAPSRTSELSAQVSRLRKELDSRLDDAVAAVDWLMQDTGISRLAAAQIVEYLAVSKVALGVIPTQETLVLERFFDETGGMQLVLHSPYGGRINRAWGLALRKKFCRTFNQELQAAATEDGIVLSLGPQHSFPLDDVFHYLSTATAQDVLVQALLAAPVFQVRWRWNLTRSLAVLRQEKGRKVPAPLQRMRSDDLLAATFPDQVACAENLTGPIDIPDHPLVQQTIADCLHEATDVDGLLRILANIEAGHLTLVARDTVEPSPLCHELINAKPYAYLDDAPLEERRTQAVMTRRTLDAESARDLGALDAEAITLVKEQAWPDPETADEVHDALALLGFLSESEALPWKVHLDELASQRRASLVTLVPVVARHASPVPTPPHSPSRLMGRLPLNNAEREGQEPVLSQPQDDSPHSPSPLMGEGRDEGDGAGPAVVRLWLAAERLPQFQALFPALSLNPTIEAPPRERTRAWEPEEALREVVRGRLEGLGPVTTAQLAAPLGLESSQVELALIALEREGFALRGQFTSNLPLPQREADTPNFLSRPRERIEERALEWCDRRLLARIHRYTLDRLRKEIEPATAAQFLRFLFSWQHADPDSRVQGPAGIAEALDALQGYQVPAGAWENQVLAARANRYNPAWLDELCLSGQFVWGRLFPAVNGEARRSRPTRSSPVALVTRASLSDWLAAAPHINGETKLSGLAQELKEHLEQRGACFFQELVTATRRLPAEVKGALGELVSAGLVTGDGFAGLRGLVAPERHMHPHRVAPPRLPVAAGFKPASHLVAERATPVAAPARYDTIAGGRWSLFRNGHAAEALTPEAIAEFWAKRLLRRYGVVFHKLSLRETGLPPWRDILRVFRRMEARGEIRGGRFVSGFSGEQYALPGAVEGVRAIRRKEPGGRLVAVSGADPLNLVGILTPGERVPAVAASRIVYRDGLPIATRIAGTVSYLTEVPERERPAVLLALRG